MAYDELKDLAMSYPAQDRDALPLLAAEYQLADKRRRRQERDILELAAIAAEVGIDDIVNLGLEPDNPQLMEAIRLHSPDTTVEKIGSMTEEQLGGLRNAVKGKYFEVMVRDKLNNNKSVGGIQLLPGQEAELAKIQSQERWDMRIFDKATGETVNELQTKATESMGYVNEALEKYPNTRVVVPHELTDKAAGQDNVISTNILDEDLEATVREQLVEQTKELSEGAVANVLDNSAEFAFDVIPFGSAAIIIASEGLKAGNVLMGRSTFRSTLKESLKRGTGRLARSSVYAAIVKGTVVATGAGPGAVAIIPAAATVATLRVAEQRVRNREAMGRHVEEKTQEILQELESSPLGRS